MTIVVQEKRTARYSLVHSPFAVFLGEQPISFRTGSWIVSFPSSLNAFWMAMIPYAATILIFGRGFCGWICPFGGLPEAMVTGKKTRWQLGFLMRTVNMGCGRSYIGLKDWVKDVKYGVLLACMLLAIFLVFPVVCVLCPAFWLTSTPVFWAVMALIVLFALILPFMSKKRWWCQICPLGAFLALFEKISLFRVRIDQNKCDRCMGLLS